MIDNTELQKGKYLLAASLGAIGGGILVAAVTRAIPKVMNQMMSNMMRNMMSQMGESGCDPVEI
jgi:hypothetical protein